MSPQVARHRGRTRRQMHKGKEIVSNTLYSYQPLRSRSVRLLKVWADASRGRIVGNFRHSSLRAHPVYYAISYCWGSSDLVERIWFGDHEYLNITNSAAGVLRSMIEFGIKDYIWIDAICVNQSNLSERGHQVQLMQDVYASAKAVIAWIGEPTDDSDRAMDFISTLYDEFEEHKVYSKYRHNPLSRSEAQKLLPSFKNSKSPDFIAFRIFLQRPWFNRLWVIQEVVLSTNVALMCGYKTVLWEKLAKVISFFIANATLQGHYLSFVDIQKGLLSAPRGVSGISIITNISRRRATDAPDSLQDLLFISHKFNVTDPRDLVFGFLGIASDKDDFEPHGLVPDYENSPVSILISWTRFLIVRTQSPMLLHLAGIGNPRALKGLPSWVSDLTVSIWQNENGNSYVRSKGFENFQASGLSKPTIRFLDRANCMNLRGIIVSTLTCSIIGSPRVRTNRDLSAHWPDMVLWSKWLEETSSLVNTLCPYPTGEDKEIVHLQTITANRMTNYLSAESLRDTFLAFLEWERLMQLSTTEKEFDAKTRNRVVDLHAHDYLIDSITLNKSRRVFTTSNGYAGLGPPGLQDGDIICIILGARTPFLIREATDASTNSSESPGLAQPTDATRPPAEKKYLLVGECYIHGLMNGEGLRMGKVQDILLC